MLSLKKPLLLFIIVAILIIILSIAYNKYCASKPDGCKNEPYDERDLSDDHMDK